AAAEEHVREPEAAADHPTVAEEVAHLGGPRARRDVEVLRLHAEEEIADAAADEIRLVTIAAQPPDDLEGILVDVVGPDLRRVNVRLRPLGLRAQGRLA